MLQLLLLILNKTKNSATVWTEFILLKITANGDHFE